MPYLNRPGQPELHYALDDYTDPWRDAPYLILQHGYGRSAALFAAQHDGAVCHEN